MKQSTATVTIPVRVKMQKTHGFRMKVAGLLFSLGAYIATTKVEITVGEE